MQSNYSEIPSPLQAFRDALGDILGDAGPIARSGIRAVFRAALFLGMTLVLMPLGLLAYPFGQRTVRIFSVIWFWCGCRICNLRIRVNGRQSYEKNLLLIGNHVSYLDIPVLGLLINAHFVAKQEVATWPVFGWGASLTKTAYIKRDPREALKQRDELAARLQAGERLILFPEGTSSDGKRVLPFKSTLFNVVEANDGELEPLVQPFSIAYTRYADGRHLEKGLQGLYAWYGDMDLFPHLYSVFGLEGADVEVTFHTPIRASEFKNRKALSQHCHDVVAKGVERSHASRLYRPAPQAELAWRG